MPTLNGVRAKIDRAEKHLDDFKAEFKRPPRPGEAGDFMIGQPQSKGNYITAVAHVVKPKPEWSVWLGEIIHDARSALDNLAYELTSKYPDRLSAYAQRPKCGATKLKRLIHFPIYKDSHEFSSNWKVRDLKTLLDPEEFTAIEDAQPYKRYQSDALSDPLFVLQELNNIDKHRSILIVDKRLQFSGKVGNEPFGRSASVRKTGAYLFRIPVTNPVGPECEVEMNDPSSHIFFAKTGLCCDDEPIITTVRALIHDVRNIVNDKFSRFFSQSKGTPLP
ncbi:MAG TPA: hypothetical protein VFA27_16485 [Vicinamibacterales bacterium]|nr:hypothetical protein [Vicinamibacterales bacterium]